MAANFSALHDDTHRIGERLNVLNTSPQKMSIEPFN